MSRGREQFREVAWYAGSMGQIVISMIVIAFAVWLVIAPVPECPTGEVAVYAPSGMVCVPATTQSSGAPR